MIFFLFLSIALNAQWVSKADAHKNRSEVTSIVHNGKLYAFIGFGDSNLNVEPSVEMYDPSINSWTLLNSLPADKTITHQGVVLIDDKVWHIGGRVGKHPGPLTSTIWIYNIPANVWYLGPELKDPQTGKALLWGGGGAAMLGRTLHVFGGFVNSACDGDQSNYHLTLDIDHWLANQGTATWKNDRAPLPMKRNHFGTTVLGGKIYAIGGQFGHDCGGGQDKQYVHVYNPETNIWTELTSLPTPRSHFEGSIFAIDGKIYVIAGQGANNINTNKVTIFDPAANNGKGNWTEDTNLTLPASYEGLSSKVINDDFIISHGGQGSSRNTQNTTFSRTITRNPQYKLGFTAAAANIKAAIGTVVKKRTYVYTIDGSCNYTTSSNASWLSISQNANGTTTPAGSNIELTVNTSGLPPGNYTAVVTAKSAGSYPVYSNGNYTVNLNVQSTANIESTPELIFSGVKGTTSAEKSVVISNTGTGPLEITNLTMSGNNSSAFIFSNPPALPFSIPAGGTHSLNFKFAPSTLVGALSAQLNIFNNSSNQELTTVGLYGLSANGEQGNNEPPLDGIVKTLGYKINVGGTSLILSTGPGAIGDEVLSPLFQKAGTGPVTIKVVARYSPDGLLPFGFYTKVNDNPVLQEVGKIALDHEQTLFPLITSDSKTAFDPGNSIFGFYAGATSYSPRTTYSEDHLNTGGLKHSVRIYPLKNRSGSPMANSYLVAFEPAVNGDYQDYVFEITNIKPAAVVTPGVLEAEQAVLHAAVVSSNHAGFTGTGFADYVNASGDYVEWTVNKSNSGSAELSFRYANGASNRPLRLTVNGVVISSGLAFPSTGGWNKWSTSKINVNLVSGVNKVRLTAIGSSGANVDHLAWSEISTESGLLEAELATLNKAVVASNHAGFTGTGFADYVNASGDYVEWSLNKTNAGSTLLSFRYANGAATNRPLKLEVNGVVVSSSLAFPSTGGWNKWSSASINANLVSGVNKVRLTAIGSSGGNIDHLAWSENTTNETTATGAPFETSVMRSEFDLQVSLFPNPATGTTSLSLKTTSSLPANVRLMDLTGRTQRNFVINNAAGNSRISIENLASGVYIVYVQQGSKSAYTRLVVK